MRWIVRLFGVVILLVVLAVAALFIIPTERIAAIAAERFTAATGRSLAFEGAVRPTIWPVLGASTGPVRLGNPDWAEGDALFAAEGLDIGVDLMALIGGTVAVERIEARGPVIVLERAADGRTNWDFAQPATTGGAPPPVAEGAGFQGLSIASAQITGGSLRFIDRAAGTDLRLDGIDVALTLPDWRGPAEMTAAARLNGQPVALTATVGGLGPLFDGVIVAIDAQAEVGGSRLDFDGRVGLTPVAEGRLDADLGDLGAVFAAAGLPAPAMPAALTRDLALSGRVTLAPEGSIHLREAQLQAGGNRISGALDLTFPEPRPRLAAELEAGPLDLSALFAGPSGGGAGWPTTRIDASALGLLDAEIAMRAPSLDLGFMQVGAFDVGLVLDRSRAVVGLRALRLFDGLVTGEVVANNRSGLSVGGTLEADAIALRPALSRLAGFERLSGTADATLRFLGVGNSVDAIMRSLSGEGSIAFGQGEILGLDLVGMLRNLDLNYVGEGNRTIYESITGRFTIQGGVLRNDDLRLASPLVTVTGSGTVDLGRQTQDFRVVPTALTGADGTGGVRVPLIVGGSWFAPTFRLDLEGLAAERLAAEREALEARAREAAEAAAAERLGVTVEEGETLEDAARRRLEERAGEALRGLLGGGGTQQ